MNCQPSLRVTALAVVLVVLSASLSPLGLTGSSQAVATEAALADDASFSENVVRVTQGNTVNFSASADSQATLNLGSPDMGFWVQMPISGSTQLSLDTYETNVTDMIEGGDLTLKTTPLDAPLEPGTYSMNITVNGREVALGKLIIDPRGAPEFTDDIETWVAPRGGNTDVNRPSDLSNAIAVPSESEPTVPTGRTVAFRVNTSEFSEGFLRPEGNAAEKFAAQFVETDPDRNTPANQFRGADIATFVNVPSEDSLYLLVNTGRHNITANHTYRVNVSVVGDTPFVDRPESITTTFSVVKPEVRLDQSTTPLTANATETIRGTSTLLPGETINVTAKYDGVPPLFAPKQATVRPNQTFAVTFDLSAVRRGDTFEISLPDQDTTYQAVRAWEVRINHTGEKLTVTENATITGETKLKPGTQFAIEAHYDEGDSSFTKRETVNVTASRDFQVHFDLSEASPDGELSIRVPAYNTSLPAIVQSAPTTSPSTTTPRTPTHTPTPTETQTTTPTATDGLTQQAVQETATPLTQQPVRSDPGQNVPGFAVWGTLVALLLTVLLGRQYA